MDATTILNTVVTGVVGLFGAVAGYLGATKAAQRQINANKTQLAYEYCRTPLTGEMGETISRHMMRRSGARTSNWAKNVTLEDEAVGMRVGSDRFWW